MLIIIITVTIATLLLLLLFWIIIIIIILPHSFLLWNHSKLDFILQLFSHVLFLNLKQVYLKEMFLHQT